MLVTVAATPTQSPSSAEALALLLLEACDRQRQEIARLVAERSALEEANQALVVERDELRQRNEELKRRRDSTPRTRPSRRRAMA